MKSLASLLLIITAIGLSTRASGQLPAMPISNGTPSIVSHADGSQSFHLVCDESQPLGSWAGVIAFNTDGTLTNADGQHTGAVNGIGVESAMRLDDDLVHGPLNPDSSFVENQFHLFDQPIKGFGTVSET